MPASLPLLLDLSDRAIAATAINSNLEEDRECLQFSQPCLLLLLKRDVSILIQPLDFRGCIVQSLCAALPQLLFSAV
jgi:hypothetical protein